MTRIGIIGGGAVGLTAAYHLASRGFDVVLYEKSPSIDEKYSGSTPRAAGIAYGSYTSKTDIEMADRSLEWFEKISDEENFEFHRHPYVWFVREGDDRRAKAIREESEIMARRDRNIEVVDADELGSRFPNLYTEDIEVGAITTDAGYLDTVEYARTMAEKARGEGVTTRFNTQAKLKSGGDIEIEGSPKGFDSVLVVAGAHTKRLLGGAGIEIPLKPYRVQAMLTQFRDVPMAYDATGMYYFRPGHNFVFAGDGTQEVEAHYRKWSRDGDDWFVSEIVDELRHRIRDYEPHVRRSWAGLCTATPDREPLLGEIENDIYVATGWQGHGFMRSPATGERIAQEIAGERDGVDEFDPKRFDGDEEFEVVQGMSVE